MPAALRKVASASRPVSFDTKRKRSSVAKEEWAALQKAKRGEKEVPREKKSMTDGDTHRKRKTIPFYMQVIRCVRDEESALERVLRLSMWLKGLTVMQMLLCASLFAFAGLQRSGEDTFQNIFAAIMGFLASVIGFWSAHRKAEYLARLFFVAQIWVVNTLTLYFFHSYHEDQLQNSLCSPSAGKWALEGDKCASGTATQQGKLAMSICSILFCLMSAIMAIDFNDAINDFTNSRGDDAADIEYAAEGLFVVHREPRDDALVLNDDDVKNWHHNFTAIQEKDAVKQMTEAEIAVRHHRKGQPRLVIPGMAEEDVARNARRKTEFVPNAI